MLSGAVEVLILASLNLSSEMKSIKVHSKCDNMLIQICNKSKDDPVVILQHFVKQRRLKQILEEMTKLDAQTNRALQRSYI